MCAFFRPLLTPVSTAPSLPASQFTVCISRFTRSRSAIFPVKRLRSMAENVQKTRSDEQLFWVASPLNFVNPNCSTLTRASNQSMGMSFWGAAIGLSIDSEDLHALGFQCWGAKVYTPPPPPPWDIVGLLHSAKSLKRGPLGPGGWTSSNRSWKRAEHPIKHEKSSFLTLFQVFFTARAPFQTFSEVCKKKPFSPV